MYLKSANNQIKYKNSSPKQKAVNRIRTLWSFCWVLVAILFQEEILDFCHSIGYLRQLPNSLIIIIYGLLLAFLCASTWNFFKKSTIDLLEK
ncbi:hypothetical protein DS834_06600 [Lactobacillus bombicola]|jgi:hypothetical protein|uniref:Uncharacterized protein n=1 Tax=Lactobacillus bombicola TaxID=1505723 RepID=A0ABX9LUP5_9LACO|nr:hypothetical protein [Lactobacillus bombicola]RHW50313.1 hypothetical protein DS834_06600 [Lactobacillus bombicola]